MISSVQTSWAALVGNPNSGKTAIFNLLTGLNHKVSNYPGVTVEKKTGLARFADGDKFNILDLPGTYSLTPESMDERIVTEQVLNWIHGHEPPDVIISVVDATNLSRNLYLTSQLADLGIPIVVALNMMDMIKQDLNGVKVNCLNPLKNQ
jgi:ferrous iron transport protein B